MQKFKNLINKTIHKELPEHIIISMLQTRSINDTTRQDLDEAIRNGILKFRYIKGEKYISLADEKEIGEDNKC